jgi:hypothetical protein
VTVSLFDDASLKADYLKKIKVGQETMAAFDMLPRELCDALCNSRTDFSASQMKELLDQRYTVRQCLMAIEAQQPPDR